MRTVSDWLADNQFHEFIAITKKQGIDNLDILRTLTEAEMEQHLGMTKIGDRRKMTLALRKL